MYCGIKEEEIPYPLLKFYQDYCPTKMKNFVRVNHHEYLKDRALNRIAITITTNIKFHEAAIKYAKDFNLSAYQDFYPYYLSPLSRIPDGFYPPNKQYIYIRK